MQNPYSTELIQKFEGSKTDRLIFASQLMKELEEGTTDPLRVLVQIKSMGQLAEMLTTTDQKKNKEGYHLAERLRVLAMDALQKHPGKSVPLYGAILEAKEAGTKYDFSACGDPSLLEAYKTMESLKEVIKEREEFLKKLPADGFETIAQDGSGEVITLFPPSKTSTTTIFVSLK